MLLRHGQWPDRVDGDAGDQNDAAQQARRDIIRVVTADERFPFQAEGQ